MSAPVGRGLMSDRKRQANRKNARRSTGPRSASGKERSPRNALKHGLTVPVLRDPLLAPEVASLARRIAGAREELIDLATPVAEAQLHLLRVRRRRSELIDQALRDDSPLSGLMRGLSTAAQGHFLFHLLCASRTGRLSAADEARLLDGVNETAAERHARVLSMLAKTLTKLDRYERRALSRRKFTIWAFDAAQKSV